MKALFLGCHCDDIELGCGGTLHKHKDWERICVTLSDSAPFGMKPELKEYSTDALTLLGASMVSHFKFPTNDFWQHRQQVWEILKSYEHHKPDIVFTQLPDQHQDHQVLYAESLRCFKNCDLVGYYSSIRNTLNPEWNWIEVLSEADVGAKLTALLRYPCYQDKVYFKPDNVMAEMRCAGMHVEKEYAEAFKLIRRVAK